MRPGEASDEPRRSSKWQARRQAIIDTSAGVFARSGYHATGITELCTANDLGKGALYHYIGSKEQLLAAVHDRVMDEVMLGADRVGRGGGFALGAAADARGRAARRHRPLPRSCLGLPARVPGAHRRARRPVPRTAAGLRAKGRGGSPGRRRLRRVPRRRPEADRPGLARHAQLHVPVAEGGRAPVGPRGGETLRRHLHPGDRQRRRTRSSGQPRLRAPSSRRRRPSPNRSSSGTRHWRDTSRRRPGRRRTPARADAGPPWRRSPRAGALRGWPRGRSPGTRS